MAARHPPTPETWAAVMYLLLGLCALGVLGIYLLGALTGHALLWVLLLIGLAALSVTLRWLASPGRRE
ncbi:MAG: hypothetical protein ACM3ZT_09760 [Bacillota bacterium]